MMWVFKSKNTFSETPEPFHLIEEKGWEPSHIPGKQQFGIRTWCDRRFVVNGDTYEQLERKKHEKKLCKECVDMFKRMKRR